MAAYFINLSSKLTKFYIVLMESQFYDYKI